MVRTFHSLLCLVGCTRRKEVSSRRQNILFTGRQPEQWHTWVVWELWRQYGFKWILNYLVVASGNERGLSRWWREGGNVKMSKYIEVSIKIAVFDKSCIHITNNFFLSVNTFYIHHLALTMPNSTTLFKLWEGDLGEHWIKWIRLVLRW